MIRALAHVDTWIFDLDNTLYPASADLFGLIDQRMTAFIERLLDVDAQEARAIQKGYFRSHGTTLAGLMEAHGVDPHDFLAFVHDVEMDVIAEDQRLVRAVAALPGRKLIFTNGDEPYARRVLARLGLSESFEAIHDIHACAYQPKPNPRSYAAMCERLRIEPMRALFVEDMARNLVPAKALGMTTVWVNNGSEDGARGIDPAAIDYEIAEVGAWLNEILEGETA